MYLANVAALIAAMLQGAFALRPKSTSICDYYTPLVIGEKNSASSQLELMLKITHTFVLGNYTTPNVGIAVHGVATPGKWNGHEVNLLPFFDGGYASSNNGGPHGVVIDYLDGGGAAPLLKNRPAYDKSSNQYTFLNHVYQYFGEFYGCSYQGDAAFPKYQGVASMFEVHKYVKNASFRQATTEEVTRFRYMDVDKYIMDFFNQQITLAVASLGFEQPDVDFTNASLYEVFSNRCSPAATVIPPSAGDQLQSICIAGDCPLDPECACATYPRCGMFPQPRIANASLVGSVTQQNEKSAATTAVWPSKCAASTGSPMAASRETILDVAINLVFVVLIGMM